MNLVDHTSLGTGAQNVAIVVQGAVLGKANFTLETCKFYRRAFPDAELILSTWDSEETELLDNFRREGVHVITSSKPNNFGISNCNLQLVSTFSGLEEARRLGADWVLKTRADQRIYSKTAISLLQNLLKLFALSSAEPMATTAQNRLVSVSLDTFKYRLFGLSDFLMFGHIDDLMAYWGVDLDSRIKIPGGDGKATAREYAQKEIVEVYFMTNFLRKVGWKIEWTLENYRSALAEHFIIVDASSIDLFWPKYSAREHLWRSYQPSLLEPVTFADWLQYFFATPGNRVVDGEEQYLDAR